MAERWDSKNSEFRKERRYEEEEQARRDRIKGMTSWDWACIGAGGEENLIRELEEKAAKEKLDKRLKELRTDIRILVNKDRKKDKNQEPMESRLEEIEVELERQREICVYTSHKLDGTKEILPDDEKYFKRTYEARNEKRKILEELDIVRRAKAGIYYDKLIQCERELAKLEKDNGLGTRDEGRGNGYIKRVQEGNTKADDRGYGTSSVFGKASDGKWGSEDSIRR